jgi:hypothetical protein
VGVEAGVVAVDAGGFAGGGAATAVEVDAGGVGPGVATAVEVDAGGFAGLGAATVVELDAGAGVAALVDAEVSPALGAVTEVGAGVDAAVVAADVEVVVPAELVELQPLSRENKGTKVARAGSVNALAWNVMAVFSYRGMIHAKHKRLSIDSGVHADTNRLSAVSTRITDLKLCISLFEGFPLNARH